MMTIIAVVAVLIALAIASVLIRAAFQPDTFIVARSISIGAPPERIFPLINDLQAFKTWSPYENKDPAMQRTISDRSSGEGATYAWRGNGQVGAGQMTIRKSEAPSTVMIDLDMLKPVKAANVVRFSLAPKNGATAVTWAMQGRCNFVGKLMGTIFNMDKMVGGDFERGLSNLKQVSERG